MSQPRYRPVTLGVSACRFERRAGATYVTPSRELEAYPDRLLDRLISGAATHPQRTLVARRGADGDWQHVSYRQMLADVRAVASALQTRDLSPERPILILSENSIAHLTLALAALWAGIAHAPLSPAASLRSDDFVRVLHAVSTLTPGLVFADDLSAYAPAIRAAIPESVEIVGLHGRVAGRTTTEFESLLDTAPDPAIDTVHAATGPDTIAKFLFTSGSTSLPKAVITTQRMLCANQQMLRQTFPVFAEQPPVLVDWLPWNHTFGGSHNLGLVIYNGGSLYIDDGKPAPSLFETTIANLKEISPTVHFNVPRGWEELTLALENDAALRESFYARLQLKFFAAAGLSPRIWQRLDALAEATCGQRIRIMAGLGATETAPSSLFTTVPRVVPGGIGLPAPGCRLKLTPAGEKTEARIAGPHVMPGYWRDADKTAEVFDAEGFYCSGDAVDWLDPTDPDAGLIYDGRLTENFKLSTGGFVSVGALRARALAAASPYWQDVVVTGAQRNDIGLLIFPSLEACRRLPGAVADDLETLLAQDTVHRYFAELIATINRSATGASTRIARACVLTEPPVFDAGEVTDKGSINQRRVLLRRADLVNALYTDLAPQQLPVSDDFLRR
jgi:feruloyl-CoA synthase